jgi:hypothetical protein
MSALDFTARALALRAEREIRDGGSVLLNGAAGDGASDDRAALNAFIARGGHVDFPPADYKLSETLFVPSETHVRMSPGARLLPADANASMIRVAGSPPATWVAQTSEIAAGAKAFAHTSGTYTVGQWVELRSNAPVTSGPNSTGSKVGCVRRIVKKTGSGPYTYTLNKPVLDRFAIADGAEIGVPTMVENVVLENVTINEDDYATPVGFGIYLGYCAHVRIINPTIIGSKDKAGADVSSWDAIKLTFGSFDVAIENPMLRHIGWYGIAIGGGVEQVRIRGGCVEDARHGLSCVWSVYGEPTDVLVQGMTVSNTTLSAFDVHDTGRDIVFEGCMAIGAGDDGFQFRTDNVHAIGCTAHGSAVDGFSDSDNASGSVLIGCKAEANGRCGYNFVGLAELTNCEAHDHAGPASGHAAIVLQAGGTVRGGRFSGNVGGVFRIYPAPLLVEGIHAPYDAAQTVFASAITGAGGRFNKVRLRDNYLPGYGNALFSRQQAARAAGDLPPITSGNLVTDGAAGAQWSGEATLVAGTATVSTTAVRRLTATNWVEDQISRIDLRRIAPGGTVGGLYVESVTNGASFVIRSTSAADTSKVRWTVEL